MPRDSSKRAAMPDYWPTVDARGTSLRYSALQGAIIGRLSQSSSELDRWLARILVEYSMHYSVELHAEERRNG